MNTEDPSDITVLRITPNGNVSQFARIKPTDQKRVGSGMATTPDRGLIMGGGTGLIQVNRRGIATHLNTTHHFESPNPIGVRPDGSVIILDRDQTWSLKGSKVTKLYTSPNSVTAGIVDAKGTVYLQGDTFADMHVLAIGKNPRALTLRGNIPGSKVPLSNLTALTMAAAHDGGLYAKTVKDPSKGPSGPSAYVMHLAPSGDVVVIAKGTLENGHASCKAGKMFPALNAPCQIPWFVVQSGDQVLAMGNPSTLTGPPAPALSIRAYEK
ncbi:hypothetical protein [Streptomyces sp. NBC_01089]|uniref:hypothetical protein n=1 Tax=Streptomyces sp. NBC_01089 TaxID=2903747 RepID=UPI0038671C57|nr:hypothetical protein OG510_05415 [Streptomyces sp. NBC_01089]